MILTEQDSYWAAQKLVEYFSDFNRIDDYFRSRKIDRIKDMPTPLFGLGPEDELFQSFDMHPEDMNFEIVRRTGESFDNLLEMTASFSPDDPPGRNSKLCVQEINTGKIVGFTAGAAISFATMGYAGTELMAAPFSGSSKKLKPNPINVKLRPPNTVIIKTGVK